MVYSINISKKMYCLLPVLVPFRTERSEDEDRSDWSESVRPRGL